MKLVRTDSGFVGRSIAGWWSSRLREDDEDGVWRLAFRPLRGSSVRWCGTKCGERFDGTSGWMRRVVARPNGRSLRGWWNVGKSARWNAWKRSDGMDRGAFRWNEACV